METLSKVFNYKGSEITFNKGNAVMVNATEMAKPFGKLTTHWLRNQSTQEFISVYAELRNCNSTELVQVTYGDNGGTWMHEDVALEFARWLSPAFAIWCNDRIKELLKTGVTTVSNDDEAIAYAMTVLQKRLDKANQEKAMLEQRNALQEEQLKLQAPKVRYVDDVLQSVNTYTSTQIAKEIGMDAAKFHKALKERKVMFYQSGTWMLTAKYQGKGYTKMRTHQFTRNDGSVGTNSYTVFTEKGRAMIHNIFGGNPSDGKITRII